MARTILDTGMELYSDRNCLIKVNTPDGNYLHQSWYQESDGTVIVYENIPCNYPAGYLSVVGSLEAYVESFKEVEWIARPDSDALLFNNVDPEEHGFSYPLVEKTWTLHFTVDSMEDDAPTGKFEREIVDISLDDAIAQVKDSEAHRIGDDVMDDIEYSLNRATIIWHENGIQHYLVLEPKNEEDDEK